MSDPYLGEIRMFAFTYAPYGWALCQGQTLPVQQNEALFTLLGVTYGGNGSSNFMLPNLAGRSPVGTGAAPGLTTISLGDSLGAQSYTLTNNELPTHTHPATSGGAVTVSGQISIPATTTATGSQTNPGTTTVLGPPAEAGRAGTLYNTSTPNTTLAPFNTTLQGTAPAVQIGPMGLGQPFSLRNPYLGMNFAIALQGVFPPRP